jgi:hypothetical protein
MTSLPCKLRSPANSCFTKKMQESLFVHGGNG